MPILKSTRTLLGGILMTGAATLLPRPALASLEFPGGIQEAAGMPCAPSCTLCHGVNPGTASTFQNKALGKTLFTINGIVPPHDVPALKAAYAKYALDQANAAAVLALKDGIDPETGDNLCGATYGCGAHVAKKAPPADLAAPLWVVAAMVAGALLRRRKPRAA
jgi:hypothetical protein